MKSFAEVFDKVLEYIHQKVLNNELTKVAYDMWLKSMIPDRLDGNVAYIKVQSSFQKEIILKNYSELLKEAFMHVMGFEVEIVIVPDEHSDENDYKPIKDREELELTFSNAEYDYTFDTFIVGRSNEFAHAACVAVSKNRGGAYNPLFIHGPSGLGKTHLLTAISNAIKASEPDTNIVYVTGEVFTNELISAIKEKDTLPFRKKYRSADVLLVDDIQFISGKESTQEEFFHTFNELYENHRQIVLTADRPPNEMLRLEDRLKTRFEWGLIADIQPPDFETRMAIIKNKSVSLGFELPDDVCTFIAENVTSNVRLLEGTVKKIRAYHDLDNMELTVPNVSRAIKDMYNKEKAENLPTPSLIIGEVSRFYNIEEAVIRGTLKNKNTAEARQVAMYLIRTMTNLSLPEIGREFDRDHTTVMHGLKKVEQTLQNSASPLNDTIRDITANVNNKL